MALVASVDYAGRRIYLGPATVDAVLDTITLYKEVRALRRTTEAHRKYKPMVIAGGNVEKIAGQTYTPSYVQLLYGCRIVPYDASHRITLVRDTFTDDGVAGRDCFDRTNLSAGVDVDIDVQVDKVEIQRVTVGGNEYSLVQISDTVWQHLQAQALITQDTLLVKLLRNKMVTDPTTGVQTIYNDDGTTPLLAGQLYENVAGTQTYRGKGAERRERLE